MFDIDPAAAYTVAQAARLLPGQPSPISVWRWTKRGLLVNGQRLRLKSLCVGGRLIVRGGDLLAFIEAQQTEPVVPTPPPSRTEAARRASAADAALEALGA